MAEVELNMSKSAISKQIADLESRLGVQICHRGRSGFALTPEGQLVYKASTKMFGALEEFRTELNSLQERPVGTLFIGCIDTIITSRRSPVLDILTQFSSTYPDVEIKMITASGAEIDQGISDRRIQIGFSVDRGKIKDAKTLPLFSEFGYLYCGANHPLFDVDDNNLTVKMLNQQRFVQHAYSEIEISNELDVGFLPAAAGQFSEGIAMLILTGNFVGFLPQHYARSWVEAGQMRALMPANVRKSTNIRLLFHTEASNVPLVAAFVKTAKSHMKK